MIPIECFSPEVLKQFQQAHQGPRKPPAKWKSVLAAVIRGCVYVVCSPALLFIWPLFLVIWAFEREE